MFLTFICNFQKCVLDCCVLEEVELLCDRRVLPSEWELGTSNVVWMKRTGMLPSHHLRLVKEHPSKIQESKINVLLRHEVFYEDN